MSAPETRQTINPALGRLFLLAGFLIMFIGALETSPPGEKLPVILPSFVFTSVGLMFARGRIWRLLAVILTGFSGAILVVEFLAYRA
jgi:hypothetical protein